MRFSHSEYMFKNIRILLTHIVECHQCVLLVCALCGYNLAFSILIPPVTFLVLMELHHGIVIALSQNCLMSWHRIKFVATLASIACIITTESQQSPHYRFTLSFAQRKPFGGYHAH